ncbi:MAG TPA: hypothetical protein VIU86_17030 [Gaiellaceae bacterium]
MRPGYWLVVALVALAAGCGGSSSKSSQTAASTDAAVTTEATTTAPALPTFATSKNCAKLLGIGETFAQAMQSTTSGDQALADTAKAFGKMADAAPSEIRDEFHTLAGAFEDYAKTLKDAGVTTGKTPTAAQLAQLVEAAKAFAKPDVKAAQEKISTWAAANCGATPTTTG